MIAVDTETVSLANRALLGIAIATPEWDVWWFDIEETELPWHLLLSDLITKVYHNATFDLSWNVLGQYKVDVDNIHDTAIMLRLLNMDVTLSKAAQYTKAQTWSAEELFEKHGLTRSPSMDKLPRMEVAKKCIADAWVTMQLYLQYSPYNTDYYQVERKIARLLLKMNHRGVGIDQELLMKIRQELEHDATLYREICESYGFNPLSPQQVAMVLSHQGVFLPWRRGKKQPSTDEDALEGVDNVLAQLTLLARKHRKLLGVVDSLNTSRARSSFHLTAVTGRITSENPQLHNLPTGGRPGEVVPEAGPIRRVLLPDSGVFTNFDLKQIELRVLAYMSKDVHMMEVLDSPERDIHTETQKALGLYSRLLAKNFNFGTVYGGDVDTLSQFTKIRDLDLLRSYQDKFAKAYPQMWRWVQEQRATGLRELKVHTLYGRELRLDHERIVSRGAKHVMNCAVNYPIQGSAAELFKRAMLAAEDTIPEDTMVLQVHDELLADGKWPIDIEALEHIGPFWTPLDIKYKERWQ